jgi:hypothetical protein
MRYTLSFLADGKKVSLEINEQEKELLVNIFNPTNPAWSLLFKALAKDATSIKEVKIECGSATTSYKEKSCE